MKVTYAGDQQGLTYSNSKKCLMYKLSYPGFNKNFLASHMKI